MSLYAVISIELFALHNLIILFLRITMKFENFFKTYKYFALKMRNIYKFSLHF